MIGSANAEPFAWDAWYSSAGGRTISIDEANTWMQRIYEEQIPRFTGEVNPVVLPFSSPQQATDWIRSIATCDIVGVARVEPQDVYRGRTVSDRYAIVMGTRMRYDQFVQVPSESAAVECLRVYHSLGEQVIALATALRARGIPCTVEHPLGDASVMHVPLALKAGFGELGRHGSIIHPTYGPLFRIGSVLTNLDLVVDAPVNVGISDFCDRCKACRQYCPADAIPDERQHDGVFDPNGRERYVVDTGKCFPYFASNNYCSACLAVCAWQHKQWARSEEGNPLPFPTVPFGNVPLASEPNIQHHSFTPIRRGDVSPHHLVNDKHRK